MVSTTAAAPRGVLLPLLLLGTTGARARGTTVKPGHKNGKHDGRTDDTRTDGRTDGRTDRRTDGQTEH